MIYHRFTTIDTIWH